MVEILPIVAVAVLVSASVFSVVFSVLWLWWQDAFIFIR